MRYALPQRKEAHSQCHHSLFLVGLRLGGHDGERDQRAVGNTLGAIDPQRIVHVQEIQEERGGDALVAVVERMVLHDEIQQVRGLFLESRVHLLPAEAMVDRRDARAEGVVLLDTEQVAVARELH